MFSSLFSFTVLLVISSTCFLAIADDSCQKMAVAGNCTFYSQCVEKRVPCGPNGYALGYGGKYCVKFGQYIDCFTSEGQMWVNKVRVCLERALVNSDVYKNNGTCDQIREYSFSTHPKCYLDSGFCSVMLKSFTNLKCLVKVFDPSDFFSKVAIAQVYETLKNCTHIEERNEFI